MSGGCYRSPKEHPYRGRQKVMSIGQADGRPGAHDPRALAPDGDGGRQRDDAFAALLRGGDTAAFGLLFDAWADPVYDRIANRGFTTADTSRIEVDAFVATHRRIIRQGATEPFRVLALRSASQAMSANDSERVDMRLPVGPYAEDRLTRSAEVRSLATDNAVVSFLWEAAEVLGHQVREVLDLHYRHGLHPIEVAAVMQDTPASIDAILSKIEAGYNAVVRSKIMWRQGGPTHDQLASAVSGHHTFDTSVVKLVADHLRTCESCRDASQVPVRPIAVFAAIPLAIAPPGFKEGLAEDLAGADVDMSGSASARRSAVVAPAPNEVAGTARDAGNERKPTRGRRTRDDDAAATGRAVGLAAFAGPADGLVDVRSPSSGPDSPVMTEPAYATGAITAADAGGARGGSGGDAPSGGSRRGWLFAAAAAAVVVVLLAVVLLSGSGSKHPAELATAPHRSASSVAPTTVPTATPTTATPATAMAPPTTAAPGSSTSTTAKATTTTAANTKSSPPPPGVTTTTAVPFPNVTLNFNIPTRTIAGSWDINANGAPEAIWSVSASGPVTVTMGGPNLQSTAASGSQLLCPGSLGGTSGTICTTAPGTYSYTLVVKDDLGRTVRTQTLGLTVT